MLLFLLPPLFAVAAVALGKEAAWDFLNYHRYVPYALLHNRLGFDLAVGHAATYYNPLLDVPVFLISEHAPAWCAGAYLGFLFGIAVALMAAIANQVLNFTDRRWQLGLVALVTVSGSLGAGAMSSLGNNANDVPACIGMLLAVLILLRHVDLLASPSPTRATQRVLCAAGFFCGLSAGLKLTTGMYTLALVLTTLILASGWRTRLTATLALGVGMLPGFLLTAGYWMWRLWRFSGNPFLPFFNDWFQSPLLAAANFRYYASFIPGQWLQALFFPFYFTSNSTYVAEWLFRDERILFAYVLVPMTLLLLMCRRQDPAAPVRLAAMRWLLIFASLAYVAWVLMFSVYRYLIPLEMLAPLLIVASVLLWPVHRFWRLGSVLVLLALLQITVQGFPERLPWGHRYVEVTAPPLADAEHTMVLMTGIWASAYVIPAFPPSVPFLRIDGWLIASTDRSSGMAREMRRRVAAHTGPLYVLFSPFERARATAAVDDYGLRLGSTCREVTSNLNNELTLCELQRS